METNTLEAARMERHKAALAVTTRAVESVAAPEDSRIVGAIAPDRLKVAQEGPNETYTAELYRTLAPDCAVPHTGPWRLSIASYWLNRAEDAEAFALLATYCARLLTALEEAE